jgi:hypothetical protein
MMRPAGTTGVHSGLPFGLVWGSCVPCSCDACSLNDSPTAKQMTCGSYRPRPGICLSTETGVARTGREARARRPLDRATNCLGGGCARRTGIQFSNLSGTRMICMKANSARQCRRSDRQHYRWFTALALAFRVVCDSDRRVRRPMTDNALVWENGAHVHWQGDIG